MNTLLKLSISQVGVEKQKNERNYEMQLKLYQKCQSKLMFYLTTFPVPVFIYQAIKKLSLVFLKLKIQITTITACDKDYKLGSRRY